MDVAGADLLMMGLTTILYSVLVFVVEARSSKRNFFNKDV